MRRCNVLIIVTIITMIFGAASIHAEETVGCPHSVGKSKIAFRVKLFYAEASRVYSDEVWKALRANSPYSDTYNKMVEIPEGWYLKTTKIAVGLEYGLSDELSMGIFLPYLRKHLRRQVWSAGQGKMVWKEVDDAGLSDFWISAKYRLFSREPVWKDGLYIAFAFKPTVSPDEKIKNGIASGTPEFKFVVLSHPHLTQNVFICSDLWYNFRGKVKDIESYSKSGWELGDRIGYRIFGGCEFLSDKFAVVGGSSGWFSFCDRNSEGEKIEDSNRYFNQIVLKARWQPTGDEEERSLNLGMCIPYWVKTSFSSNVTIFVSGNIRF